MLKRLGLNGTGLIGGKQVTILVGPNGAGKSSLLRELASNLRHSPNLSVISNTAYDRFSGMRGINRTSAGRGRRSPKNVVKLAVANTLDNDDSRFYQISKVLDHCGYRPRLGFKIKLKGQRKHFDRQRLFDFGGDPRDIELAISYLERIEPYQIEWIGDRERPLSYSQTSEFASVLRSEKILREAGYLSDIQVYLDRINGPVIELQNASSGELSLISSLFFLIANREPEPIVLIDEPENSLHPNWQREYVDKLLNALEYRNATVVIATHAPLIVTGALAKARDLISVFEVTHGLPEEIELSTRSTSTESIEEVLWRAFDVITPASHYVSEELASLLVQLEEGNLDARAALARVAAMDEKSFDTQQRGFFTAVRTLIEKTAVQRRELDNDD